MKKIILQSKKYCLIKLVKFKIGFALGFQTLYLIKK